MIQDNIDPTWPNHLDNVLSARIRNRCLSKPTDIHDHQLCLAGEMQEPDVLHKRFDSDLCTVTLALGAGRTV